MHDMIPRLSILFSALIVVTLYAQPSLQQGYGTPGAPGTPGSPRPVPAAPAPLATGKVIGDPHFTGFDGKFFDFQGKNNRVYTLLSDETVELRALLGEDLMFKGTTVMRSLGLQINDDKVRTDILGDPISNTWHMTLTVNDVELHLDQAIDVTLPSSGARVQYSPPVYGTDNQVAIHTANYLFVFVEPKNVEDPNHPRYHDRFDMAIEVLKAPTSALGGVLGATWPTATTTASSTISAVEAGDAAATASYEVTTLFKRGSLLAWFNNT